MVNTSDRIEYVRFEKSYEDEVLSVFVDSFVKYPLFWGVFEDRFNSEIKLRSFYEHLMKGIFRATIRKDDCYIGIIDGKVTSIVIVEKPSDKPIGFWDYAVSGMAGIIARIGIKDTLEFMEMSEKTEIVVKSIPEPRWHLYFLAVDPNNLITVTTNSEKNVAFYINNGFTLVKEETLECNAKFIGNWTFRMDL